LLRCFVSDDGVEDGEELARDGDEGDHSRLAGRWNPSLKILFDRLVAVTRPSMTQGGSGTRSLP
jgi:hypothetical protein